MAIRIRHVNGFMVALCAARSMPKEGDVYLDDTEHLALADKFKRDWNGMFDLDLPCDPDVAPLVEQEESNNPNRAWWDTFYGN